MVEYLLSCGKAVGADFDAKAVRKVWIVVIPASEAVAEGW